jgi:hypothetical protein
VLWMQGRSLTESLVVFSSDTPFLPSCLDRIVVDITTFPSAAGPLIPQSRVRYQQQIEFHLTVAKIKQEEIMTSSSILPISLLSDAMRLEPCISLVGPS